MARLQVDKCCFYFDLKIGSIIILVLSALSGLSLVLNGTYATSHAATFGPVPSFGFGVIILIASLLALYGIWKEQPRLVMPYLIVNIIWILFTIIACIISIFDPNFFGIHGANIVWVFLQAIFNGYLAVVVYSYYLQAGGSEFASGYNV